MEVNRCNVCQGMIKSILFKKKCPVCNKPLCNDCSPYGICLRHLQELSVCIQEQEELQLKFHCYLKNTKKRFLFLMVMIGGMLGLDAYFNRFELKLLFFLVSIILSLCVFRQIEHNYGEWFDETGLKMRSFVR